MVERVSRFAGLALGGLLCLAVGARLAPQALREAREVVSDGLRAVRGGLARLRPRRRRRARAPRPS
jgi:hypothetical protein